MKLKAITLLAIASLAVNAAQAGSVWTGAVDLEYKNAGIYKEIPYVHQALFFKFFW